ncbi:MAG: murein biosynthesis integral membrane protein MurJ [Planctomycetes bacterium]|nr:murein biosynthesis integral membrane protein MurJ [Planctomycetota bacterium]
MSKKKEKAKKATKSDPRAQTVSQDEAPGNSAAAPAATPLPPTRTPPPEPGDHRLERRELLQAAGVMSGLTILSRILGLVRDRLMAGIFGATGINDAFQLAFILPNLTRRLFGEGALSSAFVPVFTERMATNRKDAAFRTASLLLTRLALGLLGASVVLVGASWAVRTYAAASLGENAVLTLQLAEIMIAYCVLANVGAVLMGVLNSLRHFAAPAFAPVLLNVAMILACLAGRWVFEWTKTEWITWVAWSVLLGGAAQLVILVLPALAKGFRYRPRLSTEHDEGYKEIKRAFLPVVAGVALFQVNILLDQVIARTMIPEDGPVTMLAYGNRLIQLPWAIFSLSVATAALPMLSRFWAQEAHENFNRAVSAAVRNTLFLAVPSAVGLCLLSTDLVRLFYGTGQFLMHDGEAIRRTGSVVFCFSLGLVFYSLNAVLARAIYATKDSRTPTVAAMIAVAVNLALNLLVVGRFKESGLAVASAISGAVQTLWMGRALLKKAGAEVNKRLLSFVGTMGLAVCVSLLATIYVQNKYAGKDDVEGFLAFFAAVIAALVPTWLLGHWYFDMQLRPLRREEDAKSPNLRFGVQEDRWPADLVFFHGLYTIALIATSMGMMVWATRDSLPPGDGNTIALTCQRALVPVAVGMVFFVFASGLFQAREYDELKAAFGRRLKRKG